MGEQRPLKVGYSKLYLKNSDPENKNPYLVVVGTEVLEMPEADVGETDDDGDDENHQREHGCRGYKAY